MDTKRSEKAFIEIIVAWAIQVAVFAIFMILFLYFMKAFDNSLALNDEMYLIIYKGVSLALGIIIGIVVTFFLLRRNSGNIIRIVIVMLLLQVLTLYVLNVSGFSIIDQMVELLNSDDYLREVYNEEYFYKALLFRISYEDWKEAFINEIKGYIPFWKEQAKIINLFFICGNSLGIGLSSVIVKSKKNN